MDLDDLKEVFRQHELFFICMFIAYVIFGVLVLGYYVSVQARMFNPNSPVPYRNPVAGQTYINPIKGEYSCSLNVTNSFNVTILIYTFLFTEPESCLPDISYSCDVSNATKLLPGLTIPLKINFTVRQDLEGEVYFKVGCLREGVDF